MSSSSPRLRFAPSPTGHLHIGGARTALFNWLFARQQRGALLLRIEDTDRERSTEEYVRSIVDGMAWLGLHWDEGPFHQVERMELYKSHIDKLLSIGRAYKCFCTTAELEERKKSLLSRGEKPKYDGRCRNADQSQQKTHCIRFLNRSEGTTTIPDLIKGDVVFQNAELDDLVLTRSDGVPTYNLCVVIDDALMRISHIIRGDDHLNNTPRQLQLYEALGYDPPLFGHLPMILGPDKTRLSKRHGATSVLAYREMGYLPDALINFLARLGWSHGDKEIFSREELIEKFSFDHVGKAGGVFNQEKLLWLNAHYIKKEDDKALAVQVTPFLEREGYQVVLDDDDFLLKAIRLAKERARTLVELVSSLRFYLAREIQIEEPLRQKFLTDQTMSVLSAILPLLKSVEPFDEKTLKVSTESFVKERQLKLVDLAQPLRVCLTGGTVSPGIFEVMALLGREKVLARLQKAIGNYS